MKPARPLSIANRHPRLRVDRRAVSAVIATLDAHAAKFRGGCPPGELSLVFLSDAALAELHGQFLNDPTVTDVITFEGEPAAPDHSETGLAGEICVSADAARRHLSSGKKSRAPRAPDAAFSEELTLYVVHGWLHLAGYDDLQPAKKRAMRRAEARAMKLLRAGGDLPRFALRAASA
ncbi:MAG TPA: rRNA maturation RNase YbeY [Opitutaceae bacterium]|nr:rRNA maturation RNase YbeY [Opitutaceae bacterium]